MHQVVFHIDELGKWGHALGNVKNLMRYAKAQQMSYQIVVLVNGNAIMGYLVANIRIAIKSLTEQGVQFHACNNAMNSHGVKANQLPENVEIIPAGVVDLIALQERGFAYVKP
ncbi:MAG: DsrE family protein [Lentilactobacillus diolivorans]|uniref:DsrE family protein n=1 Tax=Lentilactobacillus diolivorans TaxID=179838 RepID=UPI0039E7CB9C